ncbi:hypothetical protein AE07_00638 [Enterobacter cloacae BWH 43]|nr:hypothetical protein AE07_00638 [Enterobacter cloacae BWH 43]
MFDITRCDCCLYGSEQFLSEGPPVSYFLSCLYGSELLRLTWYGTALFLSCLYGSELKSILGELELDISKLPVRQ